MSDEEDQSRLLEALHKLRMQKKEEAEQESFDVFCKTLDQTPPNQVQRLKAGLTADIDLNPMTWIRNGIQLLDSYQGSAYVQLLDGRQGEPMNKALYYPVFQMACEHILKGMWLAKEHKIRGIGFGSYMDPDLRKEISEALKKSIGHSLTKGIKSIAEIDEYKADPEILTFLQRLDAIIRIYYFPAHGAPDNQQLDQTKFWANSRYPVGFYNDSQTQRFTQGFFQIPQQPLIKKLFEPIPDKIDKMWKITESVIKNSK